MTRISEASENLSPASSGNALAGAGQAAGEAVIGDPSVEGTSAPSLGSRMIGGAWWIMVQSMIIQALALAARILAYRKLSANDVATAAWAMSACGFLIWLQPVMGDVLIQRQRHFTRWANGAFWITVVSGVVIMTVSVVLGPILGLVYKNWQIPALVITNALALAISGLGLVPTAERTIHFKFRMLAMIGAASALAGTILTVVLAYLGAGPWALVAPLLATNSVACLLTMSVSPFRPHAPHHPRRTMKLLAPGFSLGMAAFFSALLTQADNFFLGIYHKEQLGDYALAYSFSLQMIQLVSRSLRGVLLPALSSQVRDIDRRNRRFLETLQLACLITMPASLLVIPAAPAVLIHVFSERWANAVPLFQILLCGMGFTVIHVIGFAAMQSWGHFRRFLAVNVAFGTCFFGLIWIVAYFGNATAVACTVACVYICTALLCAMIAVWPMPFSLGMRIVAAAVAPFLIAVVSAGIGAETAHIVGLHWDDLRFAAIALAMGFAIYAGGVFFLIRGTVGIARTRLLEFLSRRRPADNK